MRYREVALAPSDRFRLPASHPVLAQVTIDPLDWYRFQQLDEDNPATRILGHEMTGATLTIYLACISDEVRDRIEDGWGYQAFQSGV